MCAKMPTFNTQYFNKAIYSIQTQVISEIKACLSDFSIILQNPDADASLLLLMNSYQKY
jgi:hypothetical protein